MTSSFYTAGSLVIVMTETNLYLSVIGITKSLVPASHAASWFRNQIIASFFCSSGSLVIVMTETKPSNIVCFRYRGLVSCTLHDVLLFSRYHPYIAGRPPCT